MPVAARPRKALVDSSSLRSDDDTRRRRSTVHALTSGGDPRIVLSNGGVNAYGCGPLPDPDLVAFGSSTASVISEAGFEAAVALNARLEADPVRARREASRLRSAILATTGAGGVAGSVVVLAASGTDLHLIASHLACGSGDATLRAVMAEPDETGSGVAAALSRRHFAVTTCQRRQVDKGSPLLSRPDLEPLTIPLRQRDGVPRGGDEIDADFEEQVDAIVRSGARCLLVLTDLTKTGMLAPSPACALRLHQRFDGRLDVLVDACQFRLSLTTVRAYLDSGFMVAVTGSKFVGGPAFCAALLLPPRVAGYARGVALAALRDYSTRPDWPEGWRAADALDCNVNVGMMLRWEASLANLHRFRELQDVQITDFLAVWGQAVAARLASDPAFEALPVPAIKRTGFGCEKDWDRLQTIFPFLVYKRMDDGRRHPLSPASLVQLNARLLGGDRVLGPSEGAASLRFALGQPVACGEREGAVVGALRMCASARWAVESSMTAHGTQRAIGLALQAFDTLALLAG
jgi:hypothetical protein